MRRDRRLPGLALLLDPPGLHQMLKAHPLARSASEFTLDYVRYKPNMNCLGRYRLVVNGTVHLVHAKAFAAESSAKLEKVLEHSIEAEEHSTVVIPDWNVYVSFFPEDFKLRSIARLADPDSRQRLFRRIFYSPDDWVDGEMQILNYKPERRLVLKLTNSESQSASLKFHTPRQFSRLAAPSKWVLRTPGIRTPRRVGRSEKHGCQALEWLPGETLRSRNAERGTAVADHFAAGRLIAGVHAARPPRRADQLPQRRQPSIEGLASQLAFLLPDLAQRAHAIAKLLTETEPVPPETIRLLHGDYYDKQVVVHNQDFGLIDLDSVRLGDPHEDLGCFLAHLDRLALRDTKSAAGRWSELAESFLQGYRDAGGQFSERRLECWTGNQLFRLCHHPFRDREPDWPEQTARILDRVTRHLEQAARPARMAIG